MSLRRKWKISGISLLLFVGVFLLLLLWVGRHPYTFLCLNIYQLDEQNRHLLSSTPVVPGEQVILRYTHSSDGTPVEQVFGVSETALLHLLEERYRWYGAGLEFGSDYTFTLEDGWVCVSGYDRSFTALPIRVAATVPQTLTVDDTTVLLSDLAPAASRLLVKVEPLQLPWYRCLIRESEE